MPQPAESKHVASPELLELIRWHIDRYDRLRASTSNRASILLTAGSVVFTGMILLANYRLQTRDANPIGPLDPLLLLALLTTIALTFGAMYNCLNAIATRKTSRSLHKDEIPSRFLFNWGDTIRAVDGYSSFAAKITALDHQEILGHAIAELWTDIQQHRRRHKFLRRGITALQFGFVSFAIFAALTLLIST